MQAGGRKEGPGLREALTGERCFPAASLFVTPSFVHPKPKGWEEKHIGRGALKSLYVRPPYDAWCWPSGLCTQFVRSLTPRVLSSVAQSDETML